MYSRGLLLLQVLTFCQGIHSLLNHCPRLTHLSLTGVHAFLREDLTAFCREAPPEFTQPQREVFCVFSGEGVSRLREFLNRSSRPYNGADQGTMYDDGDGFDEEEGHVTGLLHATMINDDEEMGDAGVYQAPPV